MKKIKMKKVTLYLEYFYGIYEKIEHVCNEEYVQALIEDDLNDEFVEFGFATVEDL